MNRRLIVLVALALVVVGAVAFAVTRSEGNAEVTTPVPTSSPATTAGDEPVGDEPSAGPVDDPTDEPTQPSQDEEPDRPTEQPGSIHEEAPVIPGEVAEPVSVASAAEGGDGVRVQLRMEAAQVEGNLPGERSGPGVAVTVEVVNGSPTPVDLDSVTVDLVAADGASAVQVVDPDVKPLLGALEPGGTRAGTYLFALSADERSGISVLVKYRADVATLVFVGDAPGG